MGELWNIFFSDFQLIKDTTIPHPHGQAMEALVLDLQLTKDIVYGTYPGPLFSKKTLSYRYRGIHYKSETVVRPSQIYDGVSYTCKAASFE